MSATVWASLPTPASRIYDTLQDALLLTASQFILATPTIVISDIPRPEPTLPPPASLFSNLIAFGNLWHAPASHIYNTFYEAFLAARQLVVATPSATIPDPVLCRPSVIRTPSARRDPSTRASDLSRSHHIHLSAPQSSRTQRIRWSEG